MLALLIDLALIGATATLAVAVLRLVDVLHALSVTLASRREHDPLRR